MDKQKILGKEVLQIATVQKDLKEIKEDLEIQKLKEEIIGKILLEKNRERLGELADILNINTLFSIKKPRNPAGQGNG